jgi:hypothetical protein
VKNAEAIEKEKADPKPQLDLGFKEGETIKINMKITVSVTFYSCLGFMYYLLSLSYCRKKTEVRELQEQERRLED